MKISVDVTPSSPVKTAENDSVMWGGHGMLLVYLLLLLRSECNVVVVVGKEGKSRGINILPSDF